MILLEYMHKKLKINRTKIKGGCQSGRKVVTQNSKSDLTLAAPFKNHFEEGRGAEAGKVHVTKVTKSHELSLDLFFADDNDTGKKRISLIHIWFSVPFLSLSLARA